MSAIENLTAPSGNVGDALDLSGRRVDRYILRRRVAVGGMGSIYFAQLVAAGGVSRPAAVKLIHPHLATVQRFRAMFLDEARVLSRIQHPNICGILDFGETDNVPYLVMEWLFGEPMNSILKRGLREGFMQPWVVAYIVAGAARGLHAAHELRDEEGEPMNVVHRDVSPSNIHVLYNGGVKIIDFGIAHASGRMSESTATGELKGKLGYMAPEQVRSKKIDRRVDVWALGVVLWEALTGRRLFKGHNEPATIMNVLEAEIPKLETYFPDAPEELQAVLDRALERDLSKRYATALEMAEGIEEYLASFEEPINEPRIADFLGEHFGDWKENGERMLRRARRAATTDSLELPALTSAEATAVRAKVGGGRPPMLVFLLGGLVALLSIAVIVLLFSQPSSGGETVATGSDPPTQVTPGTEGQGGAGSGSSGSAGSGTEGSGSAGSGSGAAGSGAAGSGSAGSGAAGSGSAGSGSGAAGSGSAGSGSAGSGSEGSEQPGGEAAQAGAGGEASGAESSEEEEEPGRVNVVAIPSAEVRFRGRRIGRTPIAGQELPAGYHRLSLQWSDGRRRNVHVRVRSGRLTKVGPIRP